MFNFNESVKEMPYRKDIDVLYFTFFSLLFYIPLVA